MAGLILLPPRPPPLTSRWLSTPAPLALSTTPRGSVSLHVRPDVSFERKAICFAMTSILRPKGVNENIRAGFCREMDVF